MTLRERILIKACKTYLQHRYMYTSKQIVSMPPPKDATFSMRWWRFWARIVY